MVGPGSLWVVAAKRLLPTLSTPAHGARPSEAIIFANKTSNARLAALDLLIEAWHGDDSSAFLVTTSAHLADVALKAIPEYWHHVGAVRVGFSKSVVSSNRSGIILAKDKAETMAMMNDYAPEPL